MIAVTHFIQFNHVRSNSSGGVTATVVPFPLALVFGVASEVNLSVNSVDCAVGVKRLIPTVFDS